MRLRGDEPFAQTINLDDDLWKRAQELTGIKDRSSLLRAALTALLAACS